MCLNVITCMSIYLWHCAFVSLSICISVCIIYLWVSVTWSVCVCVYAYVYRAIPKKMLTFRKKLKWQYGLDIQRTCKGNVTLSYFENILVQNDLLWLAAIFELRTHGVTTGVSFYCFVLLSWTAVFNHDHLLHAGLFWCSDAKCLIISVRIAIASILSFFLRFKDHSGKMPRQLRFWFKSLFFLTKLTLIFFHK